MQEGRRILRQNRLRKYARILSDRYNLEVIVKDNIPCASYACTDTTKKIYVQSTVNSDDFMNLLLHKGLTLHEIGHILFTSSIAWKDIDKNIASIIEDGRIEEAMSRKFPKSRMYFILINHKLLHPDKIKEETGKKLINHSLSTQVMQLVFRSAKQSTGIPPLPRKVKENIKEKIGENNYNWLAQQTKKSVQAKTDKQSSEIAKKIEKKIKELLLMDDYDSFYGMGVLKIVPNAETSIEKVDSTSQKMPDLPKKDEDVIEHVVEELQKEMDEQDEKEEEQLEDDELDFDDIDTEDEDITLNDSNDDIDNEDEDQQDTTLNDSNDDLNGPNDDNEDDGDDDLNGSNDDFDNEEEEHQDITLNSPNGDLNNLNDDMDFDDELEWDSNNESENDIEECGVGGSPSPAGEEDFDDDIDTPLIEKISQQIENEIETEMMSETDLLKLGNIESQFDDYNVKKGGNPFYGKYERKLPINTNSLEPIANRMAHLFRMIAQSGDGWYHNKTRGRLEIHKITTLLASSDQPRIFKKKEEKEKIDLSAIILLDSSGSMKSICKEATQAAYIVSRSLELNNYQSEVVSFGVKITWRYDCDIFGLKSFNQTLAYAKDNFKAMAIDGTPLLPALVGAEQSIKKVESKRKIIFVVTDGIPNKPVFCKAKINQLERCGIQVVGILLSCNDHHQLFHESRVVICNDIHQLPYKMSDVIKKILIKINYYQNL